MKKCEKSHKGPEAVKEKEAHKGPMHKAEHKKEHKAKHAKHKGK